MSTAMLRTCTTMSGQQLQLPRERFVLRLSAYALIRQTGAVVLVTNTLSGRFYLPGGGLEAGESLAEGLQREVKEETGITITPGPLLSAEEDFLYHDPTDTAFHALLFVFAATPLQLELSTRYQVDSGEDNPAWVPILSLQPQSFHNHGQHLFDLITSSQN